MHYKPLKDLFWTFMPLIGRTEPMATAGGSQPQNKGLVLYCLPGGEVPTHCKPQYLYEMGQTSSSSVHAHSLFNITHY